MTAEMVDTAERDATIAAADFGAHSSHTVVDRIGPFECAALRGRLRYFRFAFDSTYRGRHCAASSVGAVLTQDPQEQQR